ncbi:TlpA family protein disulfide reductase [Parapedobacter sp. DT-150]|uniref:TlpA family protein disulfide reductase n=1 Tax=Parapedobacter sp. DT-150 TaxID=3396162 RepID=UPI003F1DC3D6
MPELSETPIIVEVFMSTYMIQSRNFWIASVLLAIVPLLAVDITENLLAWQKDVREELINVVQDVDNVFDRQQKAVILDEVFERNQELSTSILLNALVSVMLLLVACYFFNRYRKTGNVKLVSAVFMCLVMITLLMALKVFSASLFIKNQGIQFVNIPKTDSTLHALIGTHFSGKVVYVDFWGTTCGPCLTEFRHFTKPLKKAFPMGRDVEYLYIANGNEYLWKKQIAKYDVEGYHVFLDDRQYEQLYRQSVQDKNAQVLMPTYLIVGKQGEIMKTNAHRPSEKTALYAQLERVIQLNR